MAELTNAQKKEWAKTLYLRENLTQQEIAERVGVSRVTVSNWVRTGKWEEQKVGLTLTRQEQVANLYRQVAEINRAISQRPEGERFASSKEADILGKLSASIRNMSRRSELLIQSVCLLVLLNMFVLLTSKRLKNLQN